MKGVVLQARSGHFKVYLENGQTVDAAARKKVHGSEKFDQQIICGDIVEVEDHQSSLVSIEKVHPRKTLIERGSDHRRGRTHSIVANVDRALIVFAANKPRSRVQSIDKFLVAAEYQNLNVTLAFNKWDLQDEQAQKLADLYMKAGYETLLISATQNKEQTRKEILALDFEKLYILGPSGVGKTSIINIILPDEQGETGKVNEITGKGRHTTTHIEMKLIGDNRFIVDTPGLGLWSQIGIEAHNLKNYYYEFKNVTEGCQYHNCLHRAEPNCNVKELIGDTISQERYDSYLSSLTELEEENKRKKEGHKRH